MASARAVLLISEEDASTVGERVAKNTIKPTPQDCLPGQGVFVSLNATRLESDTCRPAGKTHSLRSLKVMRSMPLNQLADDRPSTDQG